MGFSFRLKSLRKNKKLSQEDLAKQLDIDRTSIAHYESSNDARIPRPERLCKIADFFNVSVDYLLDLSKEEEITEDEEDFISNIENLSVEELQENYDLTIDGKAATDEELKGAISFIRSFRSKK